MILLCIGIMLVLWNIALIPVNLYKGKGIIINLTVIGVGFVLIGLMLYAMTNFTSMD